MIKSINLHRLRICFLIDLELYLSIAIQLCSELCLSSSFFSLIVAQEPLSSVQLPHHSTYENRGVVGEGSYTASKKLMLVILTCLRLAIHLCTTNPNQSLEFVGTLLVSTHQTHIKSKRGAVSLP